MRLTPDTAARLPADVIRPRYDRERQACGIVHFGIGAFHRAHQAVYTDDAMNAGDRDWAIVGVSVRSPEVAAQMNPQGGLYTVTEKEGAGASVRLVGAVRGVLAAGEDPGAVAAAIAAAETKILSFTITEKGYARSPGGGLDTAAGAIANDLAGAPAQSVYGHLEAGLRQRRQAGLGGLTLLSCDNMAENGALLGRLLGEFLDARDAELARWVSETCSTPSTMVDRIVPVTEDPDRAALAARLGVMDAAATLTEPFRQWVIEDKFAGPRPRWEVGGAQFTQDVKAFETVKLRLLNGAHSGVAYLGLPRGHRFVHEAIADPVIRPVVEAIIREASGSLGATPPLDLDVYAVQVLGRFSNRALPYSLDKIAADGSQKIPQRWLETLADRRRHGHDSPAILTALAAWIARARALDERDDPMARALASIWTEAGQDGVASALFGRGGLFSRYWTASDEELEMLTRAVAAMQRP